jgi:hypothetical protein
MNKLNILPTSIPRSRLEDRRLSGGGVVWLKIFCANCGKDGGAILENDYNFAFYLCDPCAERFGQIDGMYMEPDAVFQEKVKNAQIEKYGRPLQPFEIVQELENRHSVMATLARDYEKGRRT